MAVRLFRLPVLGPGTLSRILSGTQRSLQTGSGMCSKRICSPDISASSKLGVLVYNALRKFTYLLENYKDIRIAAVLRIRIIL